MRDLVKYLLAPVVLILMSCGCGKSSGSQITRLSDCALIEINAVDALYQSANLEHAERGLLLFLKHLNCPDDVAERVNIRSLKKRAYGRLAILYTHIGNESKAVQYYNACSNWLYPEAMGYQELTNWTEMVDQLENVQPRWKDAAPSQ